MPMNDTLRRQQSSVCMEQITVLADAGISIDPLISLVL